MVKEAGVADNLFTVIYTNKAVTKKSEAPAAQEERVAEAQQPAQEQV